MIPGPRHTVGDGSHRQRKARLLTREEMALVTVSDALIVGSAEQPTVFLTTSIEKLTEKDAEAAREHMRRMIFFASLAAK